MSRPSRNSDPHYILASSRTFFVTTKCAMGMSLLQSERNAGLLIDVLRHYARQKRFELHDFVVMPDHVHLLLTVDGTSSIERAVQFIKGGFSHRLAREFGYRGEVWQKGFSEVRVEDRESFRRHQEYIGQNPVKAGLVRESEEFAYCFATLAKRKAAGAKAPIIRGAYGSAEALP